MGYIHGRHHITPLYSRGLQSEVQRVVELPSKQLSVSYSYGIQEMKPLTCRLEDGSG